jgi:uncharacterized membrane protein YkvA (DUF1232 family)
MVSSGAARAKRTPGLIRKGAMESTEKRFVQRMRELLVSLPYDLKVLFEVMSDENLPLDARQLAAAAAMYCLSPSDPMPDSVGLLGYVDDVVYVRLALDRLRRVGGDEFGSYPERFGDEFGSLDGDLQLIRKYLGDAVTWIEQRVEKAAQRARYKGKDAATYVQDDEARDFLYQEGQEFTTDYEIDEEAAAKLQSGKPVLEAFRRRMAEESRWHG